RSSPSPETASEIAGQVGTPGPGIAMTMAANGYPTGTKVGLTGLERIFQERLAGRPGGTLKAGSRVLARSTAKAMPALRTTIVPSIERAAASALGGRYGGIAALDPKTGAVLALAGTAFSETGPPGSTFKIITASAGLEANAVSLSSSFPIETQTTIGGRALHNANDESCGGTFTESFAESCNSVFAPLGVKVGAKKLVSMAERYGFNKPMRNIPRAAISSIPKASEMNEEDLGTAAIGQGQVVASPLEMATVAATIANSGVRVEPTLATGERAITKRAVSAKIASQIRGLMLAVVNQGTGTSAAITGVKVAGKTGTAEVRDASSPNYVAGDPSNTDAWFVAFAPAYAPRIAVAVLVNGAGAGGETAAPAARDVLLAGLQSTGG
ncbi:MAG: penicillin-binding transpeptidase domain-containing protein, partial [Solirubrobacterales bacterium]|nr:penicillin-binding transpeptidase domain-containing protein [Solirubrobacterales bacterium]